MNAIVLAGEKKKDNSPEKQENTANKGDKSTRIIDNIPNKALLKIKDKYMIEYVIDTLRKAPAVEKIAVVGPKGQLEPIIGDKVDYIVQEADSAVNNGIKALECFPDAKGVLIVTSDIPMLSVEAVEDFIRQAEAAKADLCYSAVDKRVNDAKFPEVKRTYAKLREGKLTGGNVFYANPAIKDKCKDFMEQMLEYRKSPVKMAGLLGFGFLLKMVLGVLTVDAIQKKCEKLMGIKGALIISEYPEIGNDVDKFGDVEFVERWLER